MNINPQLRYRQKRRVLSIKLIPRWLFKPLPSPPLIDYCLVCFVRQEDKEATKLLAILLNEMLMK